MESLLDRLIDSRECITDGIVYVDGEKVGMVLPSLFEGKCDSGKRYLCGREGITVLNPAPSNEDIFLSLIKSGSILFGRPTEIDQVMNLLQDPSTSRTAAYYCCIAKNCEEVVRAFKRVEKANVLIVGCGGIGSLVAVQVAGAGVGGLTLIDPDVIEESNLNRQFFWSHDTVGKYKAETLQALISSRYKTTCSSMTRSVTDDELPEHVIGFDAVILSADEPPGVGQSILSKLAIERNFLLVCCGYSQQTAVVRAISGARAPTDHHVETIPDITWRRTKNFIGPSFGPTNVEIAGVAASLVLHTIGFPDTHGPPDAEELNKVWKPALHAKWT